MKKIWLITGISSGLGQAMAQMVMNNGDFVIGTFRQKTQVTAFNDEHSGKAFAYQLDLSQTEQIEKIIGNIKDQFGRIDILVNNAGIGMVGAIEETSLAETRAVFEANFFGTLKMTQAVLPLMRAQKSGYILQISSHGGLKAFAGFGIYNASKFALEGFSEALAQEVAPLGIRLTLVEPGPFRTKFAGASLRLAARQIEDYHETAGIFRTRLRGVDGKQEGDPVKAAQAIYELVKLEKPPLRLPLGKTALLTIGMKLDSVKADLEAARTTAEIVVYS